MQAVIQLPAGWEHANAPVANALVVLGQGRIWWLGAAVLLGAALALACRAPRWSVACSVAATFALAAAVGGIIDDAYIQFRHAANLANGHGPVFNQGERIEGASGGLWVGVLACGHLLSGLDAGVLARWLSLVLTPLSALLAALTGDLLCPGRGKAYAALLWAGVATPVLYGASGLETAAFTGALWLVAWAIAGSRSGTAAIAASLAVAFRPEAPLLALVATVFWRRLSTAARVACGAALASAALLAILRWLYYGQLVPRSVLVKSVSAAGTPAAGLAYLGETLLEWLPLVLAALVALPGQGARSWTPAAVPVGVLCLLVVTGGGDWMPGGRYLLPCAVVLVLVATRMPARASTVWAAVAVGWCLLAVFPAQTDVPVVGRLHRRMAAHHAQSRWWESVGQWLRTVAPRDALLATGPAGALPYASELRTFDLYGLCSRVETSSEGQSGHRLWGLRQALQAGSSFVYLGRPVPQREDAVNEAIGEMLALYPELRAGYRPVVIRHVAEYDLDVVLDLLWVRGSLVF